MNQTSLAANDDAVMEAAFLAKREAHAQPLLSIGFAPMFRNWKWTREPGAYTSPPRCAPSRRKMGFWGKCRLLDVTVGCKSLTARWERWSIAALLGKQRRNLTRRLPALDKAGRQSGKQTRREGQQIPQSHDEQEKKHHPGWLAETVDHFQPARIPTWQLSSVYNGAHDMATTNAVFWDQHWRL